MAIAHWLTAWPHDLAALPIERIVAQVAELSRPINFRRDQTDSGIRPAAATVDVRLLAAFHFAQHIGDLALVGRMGQGSSEIQMRAS